MFFTKLAKVVASGAFALGMLSTALGLLFAMELLPPYEAGVARYGPSAKMIDQGIYAMLFAVALGTLAEISFSMHKTEPLPARG